MNDIQGQYTFDSTYAAITFKDSLFVTVAPVDLLSCVLEARYVGPMDQSRSDHKPIPKAVPTASAILQDGSIIEMVYSDRPPQTAFAVWKDGPWRRETSVSLNETKRLVPYSPSNNLILNEVFLLASEPEEYSSQFPERLFLGVTTYFCVSPTHC